MRILRLPIALLLVLTVARGAMGQTADTAPSRVLIELFTSEGCSSCPPADALLAQLATRDDVLALSFHVTYWDRLGWRDRFSDERYTQRQRDYADAFQLESLYTPQMVVNGQRPFVGSDRKTALTAVHDALARPAGARVEVSTRASGTSIAATVHVERATPDAVLFVAWVDADRESAPDRGENSGARLRHVDVVRALERVAVKDGHYDGVVKLKRPEPVAGSVVAWVQRGGGTPARPGSGDVLDARRALVPAR